jgi:GAF domain-containing protein
MSSSGLLEHERAMELQRIADGLQHLLLLASSDGPLDTLLQQLVAGAVEVLGFDAGALYVGEASAPPLIDHRLPAQSDARALDQQYASRMALPLGSSDEPLGTLVLFARDANRVTADRLQLGRVFAHQASLALHNTRTRQAAEQRLREAEQRQRIALTLRELLTVINSGADTERILEEVLVQASRVLDGAAGAVYLRDETDPDLLRVQRARDLPDAVVATRVRLGFPVTGLAVMTGRTVVCCDRPAILRQPPAIRVIDQCLDRGTYLEIVRPADASLFKDPQPFVIPSSLAPRFPAVISAPLGSRDHPAGALTLFYPEPRVFTAEDVALVTAFAEQAGLALENADLRSQAEQRLRDLEALYRADETLHGSLRVEDVLQGLADVANTMLGADKTSVLVWDATRERLIPAATRGFLQQTLGFIQHRPGEAVATLVATTGRSVVVPDTRLDERVNRSVVENEGIISLIHVPIMVDGEVLGVFGVHYCRPHTFTHAEQRVLEAVAHRAAIAIQNARLHEESEHRRMELEALYEADQALHRSLALNDVLQALVDAAVALLDCDVAGAWVLDSHRRPVAWAGRGLNETFVAESEAAVHADPRLLEATISGEMIAEDVHRDPTLTPALRQVLERAGVRAALSAPISVGDEVFGTFLVGFSRPRLFSTDDQRLVAALRQRAGVAVQNARLYEQVQHAATLEERQRLARELHDAVTQTLFSASLIAEVLPRIWQRDPQQVWARIDELRRLSRGALAEMRTLLLELRPAALTETPLTDLVRQVVEATMSRTAVAIEFTTSGQPRPLPADVQLGLYRLLQEALNNMAKHAQAREARVDLHWTQTGVGVVVGDDGQGFDPANIQPGHLGIGMMHERARNLGVRLSIDSRPGEGTTVSIEWTDPRSVG